MRKLSVRKRGQNFILVGAQDTALWVWTAVSCYYGDDWAPCSSIFDDFPPIFSFFTPYKTPQDKYILCELYRFYVNLEMWSHFYPLKCTVIIKHFLQQASEIGLTNPEASWLFLLTDEANTTDPSVFLPLTGEGNNLAFLFNTSSPMQDTINKRSCLAQTAFNMYAQSLAQVIREEETRYFQSTEDEWSRTKPSSGDRHNKVFNAFKVMNLINLI